MTAPDLKVGRFRLFERRGRRLRCRSCGARFVTVARARAHRDLEVASVGEATLVLRLRALASARRSLARRDYARWLHERETRT